MEPRNRPSVLRLVNDASSAARRVLPRDHTDRAELSPEALAAADRLAALERDARTAARYRHPALHRHGSIGADRSGAGRAEGGHTGPTREQRRGVARANLLASGMAPLDARWIMARRVAEALEGGRAAILRPERRRELVAAGVRLGLRDFDANLVIAIVQDGRRSGGGGLSPTVEDRLTLVPKAAEPETSRLSPWLPVAATVLGLALLIGMVVAFRGP